MRTSRTEEGNEQSRRLYIWLDSRLVNWGKDKFVVPVENIPISQTVGVEVTSPTAALVLLAGSPNDSYRS